MALIYADDFQQLANAYVKPTTSTWTDSAAISGQIATGIESLGFARPAVASFSNNGTTQWFAPVTYASTYKALVFSNQYSSLGGTVDSGVMGLRRDITVKGDTLFFSMTMLSQRVNMLNIAGEPFLKFNGLYSVGTSTNGTLVVNGVDTNVDIIYDADTRIILEVVLGPDYMEVWVGDTRVARQTRDAIPITSFTVGCERFRASIAGAKSFQFQVYTIIVADNSEGSISSRIGRKFPVSLPAETVVSTATFEPVSGVAALDALKQPVQDGAANTGALVGGNLYASAPYARTTLSATLPAGKVWGACVHVQAKKRNPTNDGIFVMPWVNVDGVEYMTLKQQELRSRWRGFCAPVETPLISSAKLTFGYTHDYPSTDKIFVDDRTKVDVYGEAASAQLPPISYQTKMPTLTNQTPQTAAYSAYVFDYAKSDINIVKANVNNLTYLQEQ